MGLFSRTPVEVKTAQKAFVRGDQVLQFGMQLQVGVDPNVLLNQIMAVGWAPAGFAMVSENGELWGVYLLRRVDPAG